MYKRAKLLDRTADWSIGIVMIVVCFLMLFPFMYVLAYSLSDYKLAMISTITIFPVGFTLEHYKVVLSNSIIYQAFFVSVGRTVLGIVYTLAMTSMAAYAISKYRLPGNRMITIYLIIPMYISGGLLPTYILMYNLQLFDNFLVYILPYGFAAFNMLIMRTFFQATPEALEESAKIDGASDAMVFFRIILPLSTPVLATIGLFTGVFQWNQWFDTLLYMSDASLHPLQFVLQKLLQQSLAVQIMAQQGNFRGIEKAVTSPESIKMSTLMISTIPIVMIYPFLQRFFIKGVMIGAVKG